ncbi:MAG: DUF790 family protein [Thermosynechococcaceae cyanobacterium]
MLPSELLSHRFSGETLVPTRLPLTPPYVEIASDLIALFQNAKGSPRSDVSRQLLELEGEDTDYRMKRGLAHLLTQTFSTFETVSPLDPQQLREKVFSLSAQQIPSPFATRQTLNTLAQQLSQDLGHEVLPEQIQVGLYADLAENQILTQFEAPTPESLLHRYNLSQVQGVFYRASEIIINAHRNDPGEYKLLFRYLKLFGLMAYIEGDAEHGFTLTIDGPASLFQASTRYGLALAKLLPALLHVTKWSLTATLKVNDAYTQSTSTRRFALNADCGLVSHYPPGKTFDSLLEAGFAERWDKTKTDWRLEREVDLIPIPGSVMIPDFRLVHPDGRTALLEIIGYWRPEYLKKKFAQVRQAGRSDLILAISERLNLEKAGVNFQDTPAPLVWFKDKLLPKAVISVLDNSDRVLDPH